MTVGYQNFEFKTSLLYEGECDCSKVTALWWHFYVTIYVWLVYGTGRSGVNRQSSMAEMEESTMEHKNNITSNVTSDADTEAELQEHLCRKWGTGIPSFGVGLKM